MRNLARACFLLTLAGWPAAAPGADRRPAGDLGRQAAQAPPLARIGSRQISADRFIEEMRRRGGEIPGEYATVEQREALLDELIHREALVEAAVAAGYDRDPEVVELMERAMVRKFVDERLRSDLETVSVSDAEVEAFYRSTREDYAVPARVQGAMVFIRVPEKATDEARERAAERAREALAATRELDPSVHHFGPVAKRYSDDRASRYFGGVIGWLVEHPGLRYRWEPEVVEAIRALEEPGDLGPIVETGAGFYLVRLVEREESRTRPLEPLAAGIRHRLVRDKQLELREEVYRQALAAVEIEVDRGQLEAIEPLAPAEERRPPSLPAVGAAGDAGTSANRRDSE